jgi:hypothetical protein
MSPCAYAPVVTQAFCRRCREADRKYKSKVPDHKLPTGWDEMTPGAL